MFKLIDGKEVSAFIKEQAKAEVQKLNEKGISSCLAVIIVGDNPASRVYVNNKKKACEAVGIKSIEYALPEETTEEELLSLIDKLNSDKTVNGILCQLPLPRHIDEDKVIDAIAPEKDVEYFARHTELPIIESSCPANKNTEREEMKKLLSEIERGNRGLRHRIFGAMLRGGVSGFKESKIKTYDDE